MSITVKATCVDCGDISITSDQVTLRLELGSEICGNFYRFTCPKCHKINVKPAPSNIVAILEGADGVNKEYYEAPIELLERPTEGAPISLDDVLDLHLAFEDEEAMMRELGL